MTQAAKIEVVHFVMKRRHTTKEGFQYWERGIIRSPSRPSDRWSKTCLQLKSFNSLMQPRHVKADLSAGLRFSSSLQEGSETMTRQILGGPGRSAWIRVTDLTAITQIFSIVQDNLKKMKPITSEKTLIQKPRWYDRESMWSYSIAWWVTSWSACDIVSDCVVATLPKWCPVNDVH